MKKYKKNEVVQAIVTKVEPYGAFVKIDDQFIGFIHISEINGKFISNINKYFYEGKNIVCRIIDVDYEKKHLSLSMVDIDSRINYKQKNYLKETSIGFSGLKKFLPIWIKEKEKEMENSKF